MTPRQARTERRAAERKALKIARKATQHLAPDAPHVPDPANDTGQGYATDPAIKPGYNPELEDEFPREFQIHANSIRDRVARQVLPTANGGFVSQSTAASPTRAEINRANSQHSTGPRTPAGKLASPRNSLKHGLASAQLIIPGEDPAAFDALITALLDEHQPANATEDLLVQQIAQSYWLAQRAIRFQNQCFSMEGVDEKRLSLFLRYQTTHERAFHKALNTLIKLKKDRAPRFVSRTKNNSDFVSQNTAVNTAANQFVSQNGGFVSQENLKRVLDTRSGRA